MNNDEQLYGGVGRVQPLRRLQTGQMSADLMEDGSLKYIRYGSVELIRHLHPTLRDQDWGSVDGVVSKLEIIAGEEEVRVRYRLDYRSGPVDFGCAIDVRMSAAGTLTMAMDGEALGAFRKNRLGFCLLHPMDWAGACVEARTPAGITLGRFPELISPGDPFVDLEAMRMNHFGLLTYIRFSGDLFQTEDQRNWTDGSFKTFCTPLRLPYPVIVEPGTKVVQSVSIVVTAEDSIAGVDGTGDTAKLAADDAADVAGGFASAAIAGRVRVHREQADALPALGTLLPPEEAAPAVVARLGELGFAQLRGEADLTQQGWRERLASTAALAEALGAHWEAQLLIPGEEALLAEADALLAEAVAELAAMANRPARIALFPADALPVPETRCELYGASLNACRYVTGDGMVQAARRLLAEAGADGIEVGGGSRGNFAELNRVALPARPPWGFTEFAVNPQVHAADLASIAETLPAQGVVCRTARENARHLPTRVGAVALKQRLNPYAAGDEGVRASQDRARRLDPRQTSWFAAGWMAGSIAQLAREGIASANYFEAFGPLGYMSEAGGEVYPVFGVMKTIGAFRGGESLRVEGHDPARVAALGLRKQENVVLLLANLTGETQRIELDLGEWGQPSAVVRRLRAMAGSDADTGAADSGAAGAAEPEVGNFAAAATDIANATVPDNAFVVAAAADKGGAIVDLAGASASALEAADAPVTDAGLLALALQPYEVYEVAFRD